MIMYLMMGRVHGNEDDDNDVDYVEFITINDFYPFMWCRTMKYQYSLKFNEGQSCFWLSIASISCEFLKNPAASPDPKGCYFVYIVHIYKNDKWRKLWGEK